MSLNPITETYNFTSQSIFQNNVMSLDLVLTVQPWFVNLLQNLKTTIAQDKLTLEQEGSNNANLSPQNLLRILGYCDCIPVTQPSIADTQAVQLVPVSENKEPAGGFRDGMTHDSHTKSVSQKQDNDSTDHRKDDEYLLDIHPNEAKYFTNPRTGRKVKKIV